MCDLCVCLVLFCVGCAVFLFVVFSSLALPGMSYYVDLNTWFLSTAILTAAILMIMDQTNLTRKMMEKEPRPVPTMGNGTLQEAVNSSRLFLAPGHLLVLCSPSVYCPSNATKPLPCARRRTNTQEMRTESTCLYRNGKLLSLALRENDLAIVSGQIY